MSLLPKTSDEFRSSDYWDQFFDKVGGEAFEWFVRYSLTCFISSFGLGIRILLI